MDQTTSDTEGDDHCAIEAEEDTVAQTKKRAKRVSFVERDVTEVRLFDPDEYSATPPNQLTNLNDDADKPVIGFFRDLIDSDDADQNDGESGEEGEENSSEKVFFKPLESLSPGSSIIGSVTSNDEHFFGPISTNFIKPGRLSDTASCDDHEMTMDSTAFSMHYRSLMNSGSLDLKASLTASPTNSSAKSSAQTSIRQSNVLQVSTLSEKDTLEKYINKRFFSLEKESFPLSGEANGIETSKESSNDLSHNVTVSNTRSVISTVAKDFEIEELTNEAMILKVSEETLSRSDHVLLSPEHFVFKVEPVNDESAKVIVADNNLTESVSSRSTKHNSAGLKVTLSTPIAKNSEYKCENVEASDELLVTHDSLQNILSDNITSVSIDRRSQPSRQPPVFLSSVKENHSSYATPSTRKLDFFADELLKSREKRASSYKRSISWMDVCAPSPLGSLLKDRIERSKQKVSQLRLRGRTPINDGKRISPECINENAFSVAINLERSRLRESFIKGNHGGNERIAPIVSESITDSQEVANIAKEFCSQSPPTFIETSEMFTPKNLILDLDNAKLRMQPVFGVSEFSNNIGNTPAVGSKYPQHSNSKDILMSEEASLPRKDSVGKVFQAAFDIVNRLNSVDGGGKHSIDSFPKENLKNDNSCIDDLERDRKIRRIEGCFKASNSIMDGGAEESPTTPLEQTLSKLSSCDEALIPSLAETLHWKSISLLIDRITEQQNIKIYTSFCHHLQFPEKHKTAPKNDQKRISEIRTVLYRLVYEKAKVKLLNLKADICSNVSERIHTSVVDSQDLKSRILQSSVEQDRNINFNELSTSLDSVCFAEEFSSEKMKLEFAAIEKRRKLIDKAQTNGLKITKDLRCSEIDSLLADKLNKSTVSRMLRGSLQLWKFEKFSSGIRKYDILLNYRGFFLQRFTITRAQNDPIHACIEVDKKYIAKHFPCTNAIVAFEFVLEPLREQLIKSDRMRYEAQNVSLLLQNLLDVLEEIQLLLLKYTSLMQARFALDEPRLMLELVFVDIKDGAKTKFARDLSCLKCGVYPSELCCVPSVI